MFLLSHVPKPDKSVTGRSADEAHVVVGGKAVDGLVEWLLPRPEK